MLNVRIIYLFLSMCSFCVLLLLLNIYFVRVLSIESEPNLKHKQAVIELNIDITELIKSNVEQLKPIFRNKSPRWNIFGLKLKRLITRNSNYENSSKVWSYAKNWVSGPQLYPGEGPELGLVLHALGSEPIIASDIAPKGTQLKLLLTLRGGQLVVFKPQWYNRDHVVEGPVYAGKDRHNAEILGFLIATILNLRSTAVACGRRISLTRDVLPNATLALKKTMFVKDSAQCLFGKCFYCTRSEYVCDEGEDAQVEGVVLLHVNTSGGFQRHRSPWQRTYKLNSKAAWETKDSYCSLVKEKLSLIRILDLVDTAIFDFLIQNGDRHHYETLDDRVILIDNGKGLGNPIIDHMDILAPLYQCCVMRRTTWERLLMLSGGALSESLMKLLALDPISPVTTELHLQALDRRLLLVYSTVNICITKHGSDVFK